MTETGDLVHYVCRALHDDGVWRTVCRASYVVSLDAGDGETELEVLESRCSTGFVADAPHSTNPSLPTTWHQVTECGNHADTGTVDRVDLATDIARNGDAEYALTLTTGDGWVILLECDDGCGYEAWTVTAPDGRMNVRGPGGTVTCFPARPNV